jgi:hypothetical protein
MPTETLITISLAIAGLSLLVAIYAVLSARKARKQILIFRGTASEEDVLAAGIAQAERVDDLLEKVTRLGQSVVVAQRDVAASLRHLAVVRYNGTGDMGGQFSFSLAILDDAANGIVITSIQGHNIGRIYSKTITGGKSETVLSPEETQAIDNARPKEK